MLYTTIIDNIIAAAHERGLVINEIKMDRTTYDTLIDDAVGRATVCRPVGQNATYDGIPIRACDGCGDFNIKIITKG